jgi:hypothetical protein
MRIFDIYGTIKSDELVKSLISRFVVIPAKAGHEVKL